MTTIISHEMHMPPVLPYKNIISDFNISADKGIYFLRSGLLSPFIVSRLHCKNPYFYSVFFSILFCSQSPDSPHSNSLNLFLSRINSHKVVWVCNLYYKSSKLLKVTKGKDSITLTMDF